MNGIAINADRVRILKFNVGAMILFEELTGKSVMDALNSEIKFKDLRMLLYVGLTHEDKSLTVEQTGELMDIMIEKDGLESIVTIMGTAIEKALGIKKTDAIPPQNSKN